MKRSIDHSTLYEDPERNGEFLSYSRQSVHYPDFEFCQYCRLFARNENIVVEVTERRGRMNLAGRSPSVRTGSPLTPGVVSYALWGLKSKSHSLSIPALAPYETRLVNLCQLMHEQWGINTGGWSPVQKFALSVGEA